MKDKYAKDEQKSNLAELLPAGFEPHNAMRILAQYLRDLEAAFEDHRKASNNERRQLESEYRALNKLREDQKQEIDRLTTDLMEVTNTLEEQESLLSTVNQKALNYEKQFKKLQRESSEQGNKLSQKENDANFYRQELARSEQENENLGNSLKAANARLEDFERKLAEERQKAILLEKEARRMNLTISEYKGKIALSEQKMEENAAKYLEEIRRLNDRANSDALHEVILLKKRVKASVVPEMRELDKLMGDKMSIETASNLKALISRLITKMEQAGIDLI
jgi:Chromosome segregation ATPases